MILYNVAVAVFYWLLFILFVLHAGDIYRRHKVAFHPQANTLAMLLASWVVLAGTYLAYLHIYHFGAMPIFWIVANYNLLAAIRRHHRHSTDRLMKVAALGIIAGAASLAAGWLPELLNPGYNLARYSGFPVTVFVGFVMLATMIKMIFPDIKEDKNKRMKKGMEDYERRKREEEEERERREKERENRLFPASSCEYTAASKCYAGMLE